MKRLACALVTLAILSAGCSDLPTDGAALYGRLCAACHGAELQGAVGAALGFGSEAAGLSDDAYRRVIRQGAEGMPANRSLDEARLDALIAYLRRVQGQ